MWPILSLVFWFVILPVTVLTWTYFEERSETDETNSI